MASNRDMPRRKLIALVTLTLLAAALAGTSWAATAAARAAVKHNRPSRYAAGEMTAGARQYYENLYGVDELTAKLTESGALVRFSYRVTNSAKATLLGDKAANPNLIDEAARVSLVVPTLDKVGPLRQTMALEDGKSYWMAFSNKGNRVRTGQRVSVVIGGFRVDGLVVQ